MYKVKAELLHSKDGKLYVQIKSGSLYVLRPTPELIQEYSKEDMQDFFNMIVPGMMKELRTLQRTQNKKMRRKCEATRKAVRKRKSKRVVHPQVKDPLSDDGTTAAPDRTSGV